MKKWLKAVLFLLPLFLFIGWVNWYVDSYALLRVTYDEIAAQMAAGKNVEGLEESDYNDRNLLAARLTGMEKAPQIMALGSSRVYTFERTILSTMRDCPKQRFTIFWRWRAFWSRRGNCRRLR